MAKMIKCATCGANIASNAKSCPNCGAKNKKPVYRRPIFIILLVIVILFGVRSFNVARQHNSYVEKGYAILEFDDGTEMRSWDLNKIEDESSVKATTYVGKEVNTTIQITNISPHFIEDGVGCIRFSHSDYSLTQNDYDTLTSLQDGDVIKVKGTICSIGGGNWFIELNNITSVKKVG